MWFLKNSFRLVAIVLLFSVAVPKTYASSDYSVTDLDGNPHSLSQYRGKWIVLNFWATWCAPCLREMPDLEVFYQNNKNANATVLGVTFEATPVDEIRRFVDRIKVTYPILESGGDPSTPFGTVRVLPTTFLIDPAGVLYRKIEGSVTAGQLQTAIDEAKVLFASQ